MSQQLSLHILSPALLRHSFQTFETDARVVSLVKTSCSDALQHATMMTHTRHTVLLQQTQVMQTTDCAYSMTVATNTKCQDGCVTACEWYQVISGVLFLL
jgi:hypothetical protein